MSHFRDDGALRLDLDLRLQARALVLTLEPSLSVAQVADALVDMAGATPAAPIAARRALARLETANSHRPNERTQRAIEALGIALARVQQRRRVAVAPSEVQDGKVHHPRGDRTP